MQTIGDSLAREFPETNEKVGAFVAPLREHFVRSSRTMLTALAGAVVFIFLIGCSNLANLLLSRGSDRSKEAAVRVALGAGLWRLTRQFLCESLLLCGLGSALGLFAATATFEFLVNLAPGTMAGFKTLAVDWRVLAFTLATALVTAVAFGLVPLAQVRRMDVNHSLKQSARTLAAASTSRWLRAILICSEVALAFVLLTGAGLLLRTFASMRGVKMGCRTENLLTLSMPPSRAHRGPGLSAAYQGEVLRRVRAIPGVASAGFTNHIPLAFKGDISGVGAEGHDAKERFQCNARIAGPGYLNTMGIPLIRGRDIEERDAEGAPMVVLINETLARTLWPGQDPIGRRLLMRANYAVPVVGVVGDIHQSGLDAAPEPEFYISALQIPVPPSALAIHTKVDAASLASAVRQAIWSVDPDQPVTDVLTMEEILDREVFPRRLQATLLAVLAGLALLLAAVGLYGVLTYLVGQQIPEIGLRMALGAAPADVLRGVAGPALRLTIIGLGLGIAGALAVSRLLTSLLFAVQPRDPITYGMAAAVLLLTAGIASYLPVRRALRVDPIVALREE
jgi:putative ABC transport system permease protein